MNAFVRLPALPAAPALLLLPSVGVATSDAYRWIDQARLAGSTRGAVALDLDALSTWGSLGRMAGNEFESVVFGHHPEIRAAFEAMTGTHPLVCRMSGSGSAILAIYRSTRERDDAKMMLSPSWVRQSPRRRWQRSQRGSRPSYPHENPVILAGPVIGPFTAHCLPLTGFSGPSSNGRTADFGSANGGSNPPGPI